MTLATYHALDFITFRVFLNDCTGINFTFLLKILSFFTLNYAIPNQIKIILVTHLIIFILARDLKGKIIAFIFLPKEMISYVAICSCVATGVKIFQTKSEREYNYYFLVMSANLFFLPINVFIHWIVSNDPDACSSYTLSCLSSSPL
jgi:hypothetical protein